MATVTLPKQMLATHPWEGNVDRDALARCIAECFECSQTCTACADACLSEEGVAELRKCIRLDLDCADLCAVTARVITRQTESDVRVIRAAIITCRVACQVCAEECERHAAAMVHCKVCAEACRTCERACEALAGTQATA